MLLRPGGLDGEPGLVSVALSRAIWLLGSWIVLKGSGPADLVAGVLAAGTASWISLKLLPPGDWHPRPVALVRMAVRLLYQSILAGTDVAWRALAPGLPLRPGFIVHRTKLPTGLSRSSFRMIASLLPGSLPVGKEDGSAISVHVLDTAGPGSAQLALEEARFAGAFGVRLSDD